MVRSHTVSHPHDDPSLVHTRTPAPPDTAEWHALARDLFDGEWQDVKQQARSAAGVVEAECEAVAARMLLPWLVELLAESHNHAQPAQELEPAIRRMVVEHSFVEESGDPVTGGQRSEVVELYVTVFVRVLEGVRQRALAAGTWSRMPASPQMFG